MYLNPNRAAIAFLLAGLMGNRAAAEEALVDGRRAPAPSTWSADLSLSEEYRVRVATPPKVVAADGLGGPIAPEGAADHDVRLTLDGHVTGVDTHLVGQVSTALWVDLDGSPPRGAPAYLGDAQDFAQPFAVLYALTAEWRRSKPLESLRLGRQQSKHGLPVTFDGGAVDLRFLDRALSVFGFGGRTVHFFEATPGLLENWVASAGAGIRVAKALVVEADTRFLHERILTLGGELGRWVNTHSYGLTATLLTEQVRGKAFVRGLNRAFSHVGGALQWQSGTARVGVDAQATAQWVTLGEIAESENPFYSVLGGSLPFARGRLEAWKELSLSRQNPSVLVLYAGGRIRQLLRDEPTRFNRNATAAYFRAELRDVLAKGMFAMGLAEWNARTGMSSSDGFLTLGGAVGYTTRQVKLEAGTYYQRFKLDYYQDVQERQDVRTVYAMAAYRVVPRVEARARYVLERVDRDLHVGYLTLRQEF